MDAEVPDRTTHAPAIWHELAPNAATAVGAPAGMLLVSSAVVLTGVASTSGHDHELRRGFRGTLGSDAFGDVAVVAGYVAPIVIPVALYTTGLATSQQTFAAHGAAAVQAVALSFATTVLLKVATGRPFPLHGGDPDASPSERLGHPEYAREWWSSPTKGNVAWPSGHASAAFALASSLSASTANAPVAIVSYASASAIGVGMLVGDHHWSSDVVAGALLGQAVGDAVGRGFRARFIDRSSDGARSSRFVVVPRISGAEVGITIVIPAHD